MYFSAANDALGQSIGPVDIDLLEQLRAQAQMAHFLIQPSDFLRRLPVGLGIERELPLHEIVLRAHPLDLRAKLDQLSRVALAALDASVVELESELDLAQPLYLSG
jgi:hypothetical protein